MRQGSTSVGHEPDPTLQLEAAGGQRSKAAALDTGAAAPPPVLRVSDLPRAAALDECPAAMAYVPGGEYWMGSARGRGARSERPRYLTRVPDFCLDRTEVTSAAYARCVQEGRCSVPHRARTAACNYGRRPTHPLNCVDWGQAKTYCESVGSRLPSELEWEYAARGGEHQYRYSWGNAPPEGRTCWKRSRHTCEVGSLEAGAFGLFDMTGNVWEWTSDWFGAYPWPNPTGRTKVYRGGGWNHRSPQRLRALLRNRKRPQKSSPHLGFRCARLAQTSECPFGLGAEPGTCRHGVIDVDCNNPGSHFNGLRCAPPGSTGCSPRQRPVPGYGCLNRAAAATALRRLRAAERRAGARRPLGSGSVTAANGGR